MQSTRVATGSAKAVLTDNAADTVRGIGLVALSYFILTVGDAAAKWVILTTGVAWALLWRGAFGAAAVTAVTVWRFGPDGWKRVLPNRVGMMMARGVLSSFTTLSWYLSWRELALADTYALGFTAPLIMTVLAIPLLGERIRWRRILSTVVGFSGVLVMLRPGGVPWSPTVLLLMAGIVSMALTRIMARSLSLTETPECQAFWLMAFHALSGFLALWLLPGSIAWSGGLMWAALLFLGVSSGLAHCIFTLAYGLAPVSALAPYEYTMLLWGGMMGFVAFHEVPSWNTLLGAGIVAAAGLYNLHRERVRRREEQARA